MASLVLEVELPANGWRPRGYQMGLWEYLEAGGKRAAATWNRRSGKDDVSLHWTATAAMERIGNYWHLLPLQNQARKVIWDAVNPASGLRRIDEAFPLSIRKLTRENEMFIRFVNGASWQLLGSDNFHALVGSPPVGVVFSEFSRSDPAAWAYLSPILLENDGWAIFITTPFGKNHAWRMQNSLAKDPTAFAEILTNHETHVFTPAQLEGERLRLHDLYGAAAGQALFEQEYFCSYEAAILGAVYGSELAELRRTGRLCEFDTAAAPVYTAWDIGYGDATAIWWYQVVGGEVRVLDYYENSGQDVGHYAEQILGRVIRNDIAEWGYGHRAIEFGDPIGALGHRRRWDYAMHYLPHDAAHKTLAAQGVSIEQMLRKVLRNVEVITSPDNAIQTGIAAGRAALRRAWMHPRTEEGVERLGGYRYSYDEERRKLSDKPVHDYTSHGADAWRILGLAAMREGRAAPVSAVKWKRPSRKGSAWAA